jgi:predicted  nucleic acid-binding Zn-ribbon protein
VSDADVTGRHRKKRGQGGEDNPEASDADDAEGDGSQRRKKVRFTGLESSGNSTSSSDYYDSDEEQTAEGADPSQKRTRRHRTKPAEEEGERVDPALLQNAPFALPTPQESSLVESDVPPPPSTPHTGRRRVTFDSDTDLEELSGTSNPPSRSKSPPVELKPESSVPSPLASKPDSGTPSPVGSPRPSDIDLPLPDGMELDLESEELITFSARRQTSRVADTFANFVPSESVPQSPGRSHRIPTPETVYTTETISDIFVNSETLYGFSTHIPTSQTKWTEPILRQTIVGQIDRTHAQVEVVQLRLILTSLSDEVVVLDDELGITRFEQQRSGQRTLVINVIAITIAASDKFLPLISRKTLAMQSEMTMESFVDLDQCGAMSIDRSAFSIREQWLRADAQFPLVALALAEQEQANERLTAVLDKLNKRRRMVVGSDDETVVTTKETRERIRYEKALGKSRERLAGLDDELGARLKQIDELKESIVSMRALHVELKKEVEAARCVKPLDREQMRSQCHTLEMQKTVALEKKTVLQITQREYDRRIAVARGELVSVRSLETTVNRLRHAVQQAKDGKAHVTFEADLQELHSQEAGLQKQMNAMKPGERNLADKITYLSQQIRLNHLPLPPPLSLS